MTGRYILGMVIMCFYNFGYIDSACPPNEYNNISTFGNNCSYKCHCVNDVQCDAISGECQSGCTRGWMGPGCQYRRQVSFRGATEQSSTLLWSGNTWNSSKAVDGRPQYSNESQSDAYKTCSATTDDRNKTHWWRLQLPSTLRIEEVYVYSRAIGYLSQTAGFSLTISQSIGVSSWSHTDINTDNISDYLPREIDVVPPVDGQYVEISLVRILVLCEVEVFAECLPGWCGWDCSDVCHCSDVTTGTYRKTGVCPYGCEGRWTGPNNRCDHKCAETQWGPYCNNTCGHCHDNQPCKVRNGHCPGGCIVSWKPPSCAERCDDGTYGKDCNSTCGNCTEYGPCDKETGSCDQGCEPGLQWPFCKQPCPVGYYGQNCTKKCGMCAGGVTCHHVTGECSGGCADLGNKMPNCQMCDNGTYGKDCISTCGNCTGYGPCDKVTGSCDQGCEPGLQPSDCNQPCQVGTFGKNCSFTCQPCVGGFTCHHVTGICPGECADIGYKPPDCESEGDDGKFGQNCGSLCGFCIGYQPCDKVTGTCPQGCEPGLQPPDCKQACPLGSYGKNCTSTCGNCFGGAFCNHVTGACLRGCADGFTPPDCESIQQEGTDLPLNVGAPVGGAVGGLVLVCSVVAIGVYFIRSRRRQTKKEEQTCQDVLSIKNESGTYFEMLNTNRESSNMSVYNILESDYEKPAQS